MPTSWAGDVDGGEIPWGEVPPFRAPVFVVTHRDREILQRQGGTAFTFVTGGIERAVGTARDAALAVKDVAVAGGGTLLRQVLAAGLLDELELHIVPALCSATACGCSAPGSGWTSARASSSRLARWSRRPRLPTSVM